MWALLLLLACDGLEQAEPEPLDTGGTGPQPTLVADEGVVALEPAIATGLPMPDWWRDDLSNYVAQDTLVQYPGKEAAFVGQTGHGARLAAQLCSGKGFVRDRWSDADPSINFRTTVIANCGPEVCDWAIDANEPAFQSWIARSCPSPAAAKRLVDASVTDRAVYLSGLSRAGYDPTATEVSLPRVIADLQTTDSLWLPLQVGRLLSDNPHLAPEMLAPWWNRHPQIGRLAAYLSDHSDLSIRLKAGQACIQTDTCFDDTPHPDILSDLPNWVNRWDANPRVLVDRYPQFRGQILSALETCIADDDPGTAPRCGRALMGLDWTRATSALAQGDTVQTERALVEAFADVDAFRAAWAGVFGPIDGASNVHDALLASDNVARPVQNQYWRRPSEYAQHVALLAPELSDVRFAEHSHGVRFPVLDAYCDNRRYRILLSGDDEWIRPRPIAGLLNRILEDKGSDQRIVVIPDDDGDIFAAVSPDQRTALTAQFGLTLE